MNKIIITIAACCFFTGNVSFAQFIDTSKDRVKTYLDIPFERIGTIKPRNVNEIEASNWTIGGEVLDRDYARFYSYKEYLPVLGVKKIRLQGGWARTEKQRGIYNWEWLDQIIDYAVNNGLKPWVQTSYGNPVYDNGGAGLGSRIPVTEEALAGWDRWVEAMVTPYRHKVTEWEIREHDGSVTIEAGILSQKLIVSDSLFASAGLFIGHDNLTGAAGEEIAVTFMRAFPNQEPQGIVYSEESGVEQADAVKNQTDALSVKKKESKITSNVNWGDSLHVNQAVFPSVFKKHSLRISKPGNDRTRCTVTFAAVHAFDGIFAEVNYEIYSGYPVIRKWVTFRNRGDQWIKISGLMPGNWHPVEKYSHTTMLTPNSCGLDPSVLAFSDPAYSQGVISVSEVPSKLRHLGLDGSNGYDPDLFEWVIGPGESFESDPVFLYAFSGKSYPMGSSVSTALDRCVEGGFRSFLTERILRPVNQSKVIAPVFCTWTNYSAAINDSNMRTAAGIASRIGFRCFQLDAGWSDTGPNAGWAVSTPVPNKNFPDLKGLSDYIRLKGMETGLWYSDFIREEEYGRLGDDPVLFSLPLIRRTGGLGLSMCYGKSREKYIADLVYLHDTFQATYFKQDLSNVCYGDIARGHESRTLKESYLRGLRGLLAVQDEIHRRAPDVWLQLSHEIYWETPGPEADVAVLKHADSYHSAPNEYWGAGNRSKLVSSEWKYNVDSLKQKLIQGAFRARELWYRHRGLPLDRIEVFGAVTTNFRGSLTPEIQDRQVCSWLMGAPLSFSGDLTSLTPENIERYRFLFGKLDDLNEKYGIYSCFQYSGVPAPTDQDWHWWGKLNRDGLGAVIVLRGSAGDRERKINIPWVSPEQRYYLKGLLSGKNMGWFSGKQLQKGDLKIALPPFGQEIIELSSE
ncbi:MAG: hypothetical protein AB2L24_30130 [Mangrovibacterium sp.]